MALYRLEFEQSFRAPSSTESLARASSYLRKAIGSVREFSNSILGKSPVDADALMYRGRHAHKHIRKFYNRDTLTAFIDYLEDIQFILVSLSRPTFSLTRFGQKDHNQGFQFQLHSYSAAIQIWEDAKGIWHIWGYVDIENPSGLRHQFHTMRFQTQTAQIAA